jgi:DNA-directed RNA polymerase subunit alpha
MTKFQFSEVGSTPTGVSDHTTRFLLKDLVPGRALTIANALRRVLLSELEGIAITAVKINGTESEFSTIAGVREDVLELLLNLKQIKFSGLLKNPLFALIKLRGPSIVTSDNICLPSDLQVVNSNQYIATVATSTSIEFELKIESGCGYNIVDENLPNASPKFLNIDSIFTPVKSVNFDIKDYYKINQKRTEILNLEITTNGSITPKEALKKAAQILEVLFSSVTVEDSNSITEPETLDKLNQSIEELDLSVRSYNCLKVANIQTIGELSQYSLKDLKKLKNFGKKSTNEVIEKMQNKFSINLN